MQLQKIKTNKMICPKCAHEDTKVVDSRETNQGYSIRRRRECIDCQFRFTTFERIETIDLKVRKKNNALENYSREKVQAGLLRACEKTPITKAQIEDMISQLERNWIAGGRVVSSQKIGNQIMETLKNKDDIAYVRFASVYRRFQDLESFKKELDKLVNKKK